MSHHLQAAQQAGFATLDNPNIEREPDAARLLMGNPTAAGIAIHQDTLHIAVPTTPTPAQLFDIQEETGLTLYVSVTTPDIFQHFKNTENNLPPFHPENFTNTLLAAAHTQKATTITLTPGQHPLIQQNTQHQPLTNHPRLNTTTFQHLKNTLLGNKPQLTYTHQTGTWRIQTTNTTITLRHQPPTPPTPEELHLPDDLLQAVNAPNGLIVIASPPGHGKTTTLAALINRLNHTTHRPIATISPLREYQHINHKTVITHHPNPEPTSTPTVTYDTHNPQAIKQALTTALNGQLTLLTVNAPTTTHALQNILTLLPPDERYWAQNTLATTLTLATAQHLLPTNNNTTTAYFETLKATPAVKDHIQTHGPHTLQPHLETTPAWGQSLTHALAYATQSGHLTQEVAQGYAPNYDLYINLLKTVESH